MIEGAMNSGADLLRRSNPAMPLPAIWFPTIRAGSGSDTFTEQLVRGLNRRGLLAEITWLPHRAEYAPWSVRPPSAPSWANLVHVNSWLPRRFLPRHLPIVATVHLCVQDPAYRPYKSWLQKGYHRHWVTRCERGVISSAAQVTAVSNYTAARVEETFGRHPEKIIHNGVDTTLFMPSPRVPPRNVFRLLFAGKPSVRKGFDLLPRIMEQLGDGFVLHYTAGAWPTQAATSSRLRPLLRLTSPVDMAAAYREADALLFPTRLEGFGLVAAEAQACGLPVIATDCSSLNEVVSHGVSGLLCPQDDVDAFVQAIRRLAADADLCSMMSRNARQLAVSKFGIETMVDHYAYLYREVLAQ